MDLDRRLDPEIAAALAVLPIVDLSDIPVARETMLERRAGGEADTQPRPTIVLEDRSALARRFIRDRDEALRRAFGL
jgi:hypothetical protein